MSVYDEYYDDEEVGELSDWEQENIDPNAQEENEMEKELDVENMVVTATAAAQTAVLGKAAAINLGPDHPAAQIPAVAKRRRTSHTGSAGVVHRKESADRRSPDPVAISNSSKRGRPRQHATLEAAREARNARQRERRLAGRAVPPCHAAPCWVARQQVLVV